MIFFECYADESLLKSLGFTSRELSGGHSFGRSKVSGRLMKSTNSIGWVDEDPGASRDKYLSHLFGLRPEYTDNNIIFIKDLRLGNKLMVIRPNLESWAIKIAKERSLDLESDDYGLSMKPKILHELLTAKDGVNTRNKFLKFMVDVSGHQSIVKLKKFIKE